MNPCQWTRGQAKACVQQVHQQAGHASVNKWIPALCTAHGNAVYTVQQMITVAASTHIQGLQCGCAHKQGLVSIGLMQQPGAQLNSSLQQPRLPRRDLHTPAQQQPCSIAHNKTSMLRTQHCSCLLHYCWCDSTVQWRPLARVSVGCREAGAICVALQWAEVGSSQALWCLHTQV